MSAAAVYAWLADIGEEDIQDWSNKGLLRRGRKLAEKAAPEAVDVDGDYLRAHLDGHCQTLRGAGFDHLECACPATGICHHLVAFTLLAKAKASEIPGDDPSASQAPPDWLTGPEAALQRSLGRPHMERAQRWMRLGMTLELEETPAGWVAEVAERDTYRVRIPRSSGPAAATCTCGAARCPHKALTILELRRRLGLFDPDSVEEVLSAEQTQSLRTVEDWILRLAGSGLTGLPSTVTDEGRVLATVVRQADLPRIAAMLTGLTDLLDEESRGRAHADIRGIATRLASLRLLIVTLRRASSRMPLLRLIGVSRTLYRKTHGLRLIGVGAERWQGGQGQEGLSLHFHAPEEGRWYRFTETRRPMADQRDPWTPEEAWDKGRWSDGPLLRELPSSAVLLHTAWTSADGRLSGRPGTRLESQTLTHTAEGLPIEDDFAAMHRRYAQVMTEDPLAPLPRLPAIVRVQTAEQPRFDAHTQWWSQEVADAQGGTLTLGILIRGAVSAYKRRRMDMHWRSPAPGRRLIFGVLQRARAGLALDPIALLDGDKGKWLHLTLK